MAEPFTDDARIWPILVELLDCYRSELAKRHLDDACLVTLSPGLSVDMASEEDYGWVRLAGIFPSSTFPVQDSTTIGCATQYAATAELGMARCIEVPETAVLDELTNAAYVQKQLADWAAMRAAVDCCLSKGEFLVKSGQYQPFGPEGGKFGGAMTVTFARE